MIKQKNRILIWVSKDIKEKNYGVPLSGMQLIFPSGKLNLDQWALSSMHWDSLKIDLRIKKGLNREKENFSA